MKLIVGLGNPGQKYKETRHNIGFQVLDCFRKKEGFPCFRMDKKFNGLTSRKEEVTLLKPQTYMNKSGISVSSFSHYYKVDPKDILVIHDDADFDLGRVKIDKNRSSGGHNGVQSIINHLSTKNFWRVRFGISTGNKKAGDIALQKFPKEKRGLIEKITEKTVKEIKKGLSKSFEKKSIKEKD